MKLKIIIPIILAVVAVGAVVLLLRPDGIVNTPPIGGGKNAKLPCPDISFSLDNRTFFERLFSFASLVFATSPSSPLRSGLCLLEKPILNNPVTLLYKFKSVTPAPNTVAKIELPESFVLVSGNPEWRGNLTENQEQIFKVTIKSTKVGYYQLKASVLNKGEGHSFGDADVIDIEITPNDAILDSRPKNNWYHLTQGQAIRVAENNQAINSQLIISNNPELKKEITVTYRVTPIVDIPDPQRTQLSLVFPPKGFKVVKSEFPSGGETYKHNTQLSWKGSIARNQTVEIKATFRITDTGQGSIYGSLNVQQGGGITEFMRDAKVAELYVDKYGGTFTLK